MIQIGVFFHLICLA